MPPCVLVASHATPPNLQTSILPYLHSYSDPPALHTSIPPRGWSNNAALELIPPYLYVCTPSARLQNSMPHTTTSTRVQRASRVPYLHVCTPVVHPQSYNTPCLRNCKPSRRHTYSAPQELRTFTSARQFPKLQKSIPPKLHAFASSHLHTPPRALYLHTSTSLHVHRDFKPPYLYSSLSLTCQSTSGP